MSGDSLTGLIALTVVAFIGYAAGYFDARYGADPNAGGEDE